MPIKHPTWSVTDRAAAVANRKCRWAGVMVAALEPVEEMESEAGDDGGDGGWIPLSHPEGWNQGRGLGMTRRCLKMFPEGRH